jgi:hypothetical protein
LIDLSIISCTFMASWRSGQSYSYRLSQEQGRTTLAVLTSTTSRPTPASFCFTGSILGVKYAVSHSGASEYNMNAKAVGIDLPLTAMFTLESAGHLVSLSRSKAYIPPPFNDPQVIRLLKDQTVNVALSL